MKSSTSCKTVGGNMNLKFFSLLRYDNVADYAPAVTLYQTLEGAISAVLSDVDEMRGLHDDTNYPESAEISNNISETGSSELDSKDGVTYSWKIDKHEILWENERKGVHDYSNGGTER